MGHDFRILSLIKTSPIMLRNRIVTRKDLISKRLQKIAVKVKLEFKLFNLSHFWFLNYFLRLNLHHLLTIVKLSQIIHWKVELQMIKNYFVFMMKALMNIIMKTMFLKTKVPKLLKKLSPFFISTKKEKPKMICIDLSLGQSCLLTS